MRPTLLAIAALVLLACPAAARPVQDPPVQPQRSIALGKPFSHGRLLHGVQLADFGEDHFTWDPVYDVSPNRPDRRWGTDRLVSLLLRVFHAYRTEHDSVQRVGVMDLSRPHGGPFGRKYGGLGHASHQNGLDADVLYPRKDGLELRAFKPSQVDRALAQDLVDRFVAAGAQKIFVGPHLDLHGPRNVVVPLIYHDDHMHVRIANVRR
ncbi:penicillin-insensitive murein endopeptidase [Candidatus Solirubrobacter pratensis]|uniref:penicillin-insensitive murein endopeptidase n=1 Tax=Candidatus Solirubrobacter pratensis TaxID=1298857 RepID=UPI0004116D4F|nr:penicillin-insensitive murein endopeptidase [Candidatus Solirubrobacter pratensis]